MDEVRILLSVSIIFTMILPHRDIGYSTAETGGSHATFDFERRRIYCRHVAAKNRYGHPSKGVVLERLAVSRPTVITITLVRASSNLRAGANLRTSRRHNFLGNQVPRLVPTSTPPPQTTTLLPQHPPLNPQHPPLLP